MAVKDNSLGESNRDTLLPFSCRPSQMCQLPGTVQQCHGEPSFLRRHNEVKLTAARQDYSLHDTLCIAARQDYSLPFTTLCALSEHNIIRTQLKVRGFVKRVNIFDTISIRKFRPIPNNRNCGRRYGIFGC